MGLSAREAKILERLMKKKDEPDPPSIGKTLNISMDLGDEKQVERARGLGLLGFITDDDDDDDTDDEKNDDETDDDDAPKRRGYFQ